MPDAASPKSDSSDFSDYPDAAALRRLFEFSPVGVCHVASPSRLCWANPALARMLGYGSPADLAVHEDVRCLFAEAAGLKRLTERLRRDGGVIGFECNLRRRDGGVVGVQLSVVAEKDAAGETPGYDVFVEDVTDRKAVEILREEVARMTRHDLKGPLNAVMGLSELLQDEDVPPSARELGEMIHAAGQSMLEKINTSLALYQLELGQCEMRVAPLDPEALVRDVAKEMEGLRRGKGLDVRVTVCRAPGKRGPLALAGDRLLFMAMVRHLLLNALEASPRNETVGVELVEEGAMLRLGVRNRGAVPGEVRRLFFEKFVTTGKRRGTGVGTYVVRLVAEAHGGGVGFISSQDKGTEVWATLPLGGPPRD